MNDIESPPAKSIEHDFFSATDLVKRSEIFDELNAEARKGRGERILWSVMLVGALGAVITAIMLFPPTDPAADPPPRSAVTKLRAPIVAASSAGALTRPAATPAVSNPIAKSPKVPAVRARIESMPAPRLARRLQAFTLGEASAPDPAIDAARTAIEQGNYADALKRLKSVDESPKVFALRGRALLELGQEGKALTALKKARTLAPEDGETMVLLGALLIETAPQEARAHFAAYLDRYPEGIHAVELKSLMTD